MKHSRRPSHHENLMDSVPEPRHEGEWFPANGPLHPLPLHLPILEMQEREQQEVPTPHGHYHGAYHHQSGRDL